MYKNPARSYSNHFIHSISHPSCEQHSKLGSNSFRKWTKLRCQSCPNTWRITDQDPPCFCSITNLNRRCLDVVVQHRVRRFNRPFPRSAFVVCHHWEGVLMLIFAHGVVILADFSIDVSRFVVVHQSHIYGIDINAEHQYVAGKARGGGQSVSPRNLNSAS